MITFCHPENRSVFDGIYTKLESSCVCTKPVPGMASAHIQKQRFRRDFRVGAKPRRSHLESGTSLNIGEVRRQYLCPRPAPF